MTNFTPCSNISIVNFEHVIAVWKYYKEHDDHAITGDWLRRPDATTSFLFIMISLANISNFSHWNDLKRYYDQIWSIRCSEILWKRYLCTSYWLQNCLEFGWLLWVVSIDSLIILVTSKGDRLIIFWKKCAICDFADEILIQNFLFRTCNIHLTE